MTLQLEQALPYTMGMRARGASHRACAGSWRRALPALRPSYTAGLCYYSICSISRKKHFQDSVAFRSSVAVHLYVSSAKLCYIDLLLIDIKTASRVLRVPLARFHTIFELSPIIRFRVTGIHPGVTDSQHW